jgi:anhydro-N-acetylmuramic acid kinase
VIVLGLMSGTSMDGIDAAVADLALAGEALTLRALGHTTVDYSPELRNELVAALPPASTTLEAVCRLHTRIGQEFAAAAEQALSRQSVGADLIVSHGQTVFHWVEDGRVEGTLQLGGPAWIAERTGLPVVSDLRSADVAAGGQGAPLVSLFDTLLLGPEPGGPGVSPEMTEARAALNLGGIANLTVVPSAGPPFAYDAGPANALLDAAVVSLTGGAERCDRDGRRAARGQVHPGLLAALHDDGYYRRPPPKTTGKERFHAGYLEAVLARVGEAVDPDDLLATLTAHAAEVVAAECRRHSVAEVVASGGGTANPVLMSALEGRLGPECRLRRIDDLGIASEAKEAYAFAVLGYLTVNGLPGALPACTGARRGTLLGNITPGARPLVLPPPAGVVPSRLEIL